MIKVNHMYHLGRLISMGNRDTRAYNYGQHMMYEIWENNNYLRICIDKKTGSVLTPEQISLIQINGNASDCKRTGNCPEFLLRK
jgi:Spy/CpxP family protein refolding chaperone